MRTFPVVAMLLFFFGVGVCAESQPPTEKTKRSEHDTYQIQRGTEQFPLVVKTVQPPKSKEETESDSEERDDRKTLNRLTLCLAVIGFFQLIVFGLQARRLRQTIEVTEKAANAAEKSASALPLIERAHVFVEIGLDGLGFNFPKGFHFYKDANDLGTCSVIAHFKNHGKTPAILTKLHLVMDKVPAYAYPTEITEIIKSEIPPGIVISSELTYDIPATTQITPDEWERINAGEILLICYGRVEYKDVLGDKHGTGFCWEYSPLESRKCFYLSPTEKLNHYN